MNKRKRDDESQLLSKNIYQAVSDSNHELLETLLVDEKFSDVNAEHEHLSMLDLAVQLGNYTATKLLLDHVALPDYNQTPNTDRINWRLRLKDSINIKSSFSILDEATCLHKFKYKYTYIESTLCKAIIKGNYDIVKLLIERGCDPDAHPECWYNVVLNNKLPIFKLLMECTGRKVGNNSWCQEMMLTACGTGSDNIIFYLIDEGVPVDVQLHGQTGAFRALIGNKHKTFIKLVNKGADLEFTDLNDLSLLHAAVFSGFRESIQFLLDKGIDVNIRDMYGRTPLHYAVCCGHSQILDLLFNHGADVNAADNFGLTPVMIATRNNSSLKTIQHLLQQENIDLVKQDSEGRTVLHHLIWNRRAFKCDSDKYILFRSDFDINVRDKKNRTFLQYAIEFSRVEFIKILLDFGADTNELPKYRECFVKNKTLIQTLKQQKMKRLIAGLDNDANIDVIEDKLKILDYSKILENNDVFKQCEEQIKIMKKTFLYDNLTYFNFLHAKKRVRIKVAQKQELREIFYTKICEFPHYYYMLAGIYVDGTKFTETESKALKLVEDNLVVISNYMLPSTVTYNIKKYIDIEDMVTLQKMNFFESSDNENV